VVTGLPGQQNATKHGGCGQQRAAAFYLPVRMAEQQ
jgi:hypothetical protein